MPEIPYRVLGRTGERVSAIGLGGSHLGGSDLDEALAIRIIHAAMDRGLNFLDNSWDYHAGESERRVGKALRNGRREKAFLMTKIDGRSKKEAAKQLDESLRRLRTDYVDLIQHHEVIRYDDPHRIFDEGGANEALIEAKQAGKARYIGFTGHKDPQIHLQTLEVAHNHGFRFDAVQLPLNVMDAHYRSFERMVLPALARLEIAALGMKSMGGGVILKSKVVSPIECLHYALNLPTSVVITGVDSMEILDQTFEAASTFQPLSEQEVQALLAKTKSAAANGELELFKTASVFDSTAQNPGWLGAESERVQELAAP